MTDAALEAEQPEAPDAVPPLTGPVARALTAASMVLAVFGTIGTLGIMAIINADVFGRAILSAPVPATAEIVSAAIVSVVFLQLSYAVREGRSVRSDMLIGRLRLRSARAADALDAFHHLAGTVMLVILVRYIWPKVADAMTRYETVGLEGMFTMPAWPFSLCVLVGVIAAGLQYALLTGAYLRCAMFGRPGTRG